MSYHHLTVSERESIALLHFSGHSQAEIAKQLGRSPGTISRELRRNGTASRYSAFAAQRRAQSRRRGRPLRRKLDDGELRTAVERCLSLCWSPEEIAGRLRREHPGERDWSISYQTIYRWIWSDLAVRHKCKWNLRHGRYRRRRPGSSASIRNRRSIHERPAEVKDRDRLGDWEGDTIVGKGHRGYVATFVERRSGYLCADVMKDRRSRTLNRSAERAFRSIPPELRKTLTLDNGTEFASHERLSRRLGIEVYFADPYASWQRGTNENTNGLLRQFLPKTRDFNDLGRVELAFHVNLLNNRPRKRLNYRTPKEVITQEANVALEM